MAFPLHVVLDMQFNEVLGATYGIATPLLATLFAYATGIPVWGSLWARPLVLVGVLAAHFLIIHWVSQRGSLPDGFDPRLKGKHAIVTGATHGIGVRVAVTLARWGARVVIGCRDVEAGERVRRQLLEELRSTDPEQITILPLDLSSQASVREFVNQWKKKKISTLDILINNAGIMMTPFATTKEGLELQVGTNYVGHFLLTHLLMDELKAAQGRVVNVSSAMHFAAGESPLPLDYIARPTPQGYNPTTAYGWAKAAAILHARELNARFSDSEEHGVTAYSVHPGIVNTNIMSGGNGKVFTAIFGHTLGWLIQKTPQRGAEAVLYCAVHQAATPGGYHKDCRPCDTYTRMVQDDTQAKRLWAWSERACGISK